MNEPRLTSLSHGGGCGCKISPALLSEILKNAAAKIPAPPQLLVGLETSDDAAVYQINENQAIVATTDFFMPIVDDPFDFGQIAATNALSDIYAMGATPIMALALVGMPIKTLSTDTIGKILSGGVKACENANILIAGGHSIDSVEPIYGLVAIGIINPKNIKTNAGAKAGDVLILGKSIGVGIYSAALKKNNLSADNYKNMIASTTKLNTAGASLSNIAGVNAITDVTGFSLAGHSLEMARAAKVKLKINWANVPLLPEVHELAKSGAITGASHRNWDSFGSYVILPAGFDDVQRALLTDPQTSGGLLVSCAPDSADEVLNTFKNQGFESAAIIGQVLAGDDRTAGTIEVA